MLLGARRIRRQGLVVGTTGNVSGRDGGRIWITPSHAGYEGMRARDMIAVELASGAVLSRGRPSLELETHLAIYRRRPDVGAIVHTHSPYATAAGMAPGVSLAAVEDLPYAGIDAVRMVERAAPGSWKLAREAAEALADAEAALLRAHGVLCVAESVELAVARAEVVEHAARVEYLSRAYRQA